MNLPLRPRDQIGKEKASMHHTAHFDPRALPRQDGPRRGLGHALVVAGLALTVLWLGMVAWGVAILVNAAL